MTLEEKFENVALVYDTPLNILRTNVQIADEFAIGFAEWLDNKYYQGENVNEYHRSIDEYREGKHYTATQLLEIYKKEKGL